MDLNASSTTLSKKLRKRQNKREQTLYINVYGLKDLDRCNLICNPVGFGALHSALQVGKYEFAFGGNQERSESGIYINAPRKNRSFIFKYAIAVEYKPDEETGIQEPISELTAFEIYNVLIPRLGQRYLANKYDVLKLNCNHFTDEFLRIITGGRFKIPNYINRAANWGAIFHHVVPAKYLNYTTPNPQQSSTSPNQSSSSQSSNALENINQASSYALLCNENVLGWTNSSSNIRNSTDIQDTDEESKIVDGQQMSFTESEKERRNMENSTHQKNFVSFGDSMNSQQTCAFPQLSDDQVSDSDFSDEQSISLNLDNSMQLQSIGIMKETSSQKNAHDVSSTDSHKKLCSLETLQSSFNSSKNQGSSYRQGSQGQARIDDEQPNLEMYDSLSNGQCFRKPKFDYKEYIKAALLSPNLAPEDAFKPRTVDQASDSSQRDSSGQEEDKYDEDQDGLDMPRHFRSRREERLYLGRGYNRLGQKKIINIQQALIASEENTTQLLNDDQQQDTEVQMQHGSAQASSSQRRSRRTPKPRTLRPAVSKFLSKLNLFGLSTPSSDNSQATNLSQASRRQREQQRQQS